MTLDVASGAQKELASQRANMDFPVFSPDAKKIAFFQDMEIGTHLFVIGNDGSDLRQITRGAGEGNIMPQWSPDASYLYFYRVRPAPSFRKVPLDGSESVDVALWDWNTQFQGQIDPSGRAFAYTVRDSGRVKSTPVRDLATGAEKLLGLPLYGPRWSLDGQEIAGWTEDGHIAICSAAGERCSIVTSGIRPRWSGDGSSIYFLRPGPSNDSFELWRVARNGSNERRIATLGPFRPMEVHFDVSRTDQVVWGPFQEREPELWLADLP